MKPRESVWSPRHSGEWRLCRTENVHLGPSVKRTWIKLPLESERSTRRGNMKRKSETWDQTPGFWGIKREGSDSIANQRRQSWESTSSGR